MAMNFGEVIAAGVQGPVPRTSASFDRIADAFYAECQAYFNDHVDGQEITKSRHVLYHPQCFDSITNCVDGLRAAINSGDTYETEGKELVANTEFHCGKLRHREQHGLTVAHAHTNRAFWQGLNALLAMALALRPRSEEWMRCEETWEEAPAVAATCIAVLRIRRLHPEELAFADPNGPVDPLDFAFRLRERQAETAQIVCTILVPGGPDEAAA